MTHRAGSNIWAWDEHIDFEKVGSPDNNRFFGVELELDDGDLDEFRWRLSSDSNLDGTMFLVEDGSLNRGIEVVTQPMGLREHLTSDFWTRVTHHANRAGYKSHASNTCGLHVHVSRDGIDSDAVDRIVYLNERFWSSWVKFSRRKPREIERWAENFLRLSDRKTLKMQGVKDSDISRDKYMAVNISRSSTIEFRLFKGSTLKSTILASIELVDAIVNIAVNMTDKEVESLSWEDLVEKFEEYQYINKYLERINLLEESDVEVDTGSRGISDTFTQPENLRDLSFSEFEENRNYYNVEVDSEELLNIMSGHYDSQISYLLNNLVRFQREVYADYSEHDLHYEVDNDCRNLYDSSVTFPVREGDYFLLRHVDSNRYHRGDAWEGQVGRITEIVENSVDSYRAVIDRYVRGSYTLGRENIAKLHPITPFKIEGKYYNYITSLEEGYVFAMIDTREVGVDDRGEIMYVSEFISRSEIANVQTLPRDEFPNSELIIIPRTLVMHEVCQEEDSNQIPGIGVMHPVLTNVLSDRITVTNNDASSITISSNIEDYDDDSQIRWLF